MEFDFNVNEVLPDIITFVDHKRSPFHQNAQHTRPLRSQLDKIIDSLGNASSKAQGLHTVITTAIKLQHSDHEMFIRKDPDANRGSGAVIGMIKVGRKTLFLLDSHGIQNEVVPLCVLDFYVHSSRQRNGYGKQLFEHMLKTHNLQPTQVAIDRPSFKFQSFLKKHYGLQNSVAQPNKFLVFNQFFRDLNAVGYVPRRSQRRRYVSGNAAQWPPVHPYRRNSAKSDHEPMQPPPRRLSSRRTSRNEQPMDIDVPSTELVATVLPPLAVPPSREHSAGSVRSVGSAGSRESSANTNRALAAQQSLYSRHGSSAITRRQKVEQIWTRNAVSAGRLRSLHASSQDNPLAIGYDIKRSSSLPGQLAMQSSKSATATVQNQTAQPTRNMSGLSSTGNYAVSSRLHNHQTNRGTGWNVFGIPPVEMSSQKHGRTFPF